MQCHLVLLQIFINVHEYICLMPTSHQITIEDLTFDYLESGDPSYPLVMLLHGFPESSYMWRRLMDELGAMGYYCIAPDLRGYSSGACPKAVNAYTVRELAGDILAIAESKQQQFHLIAHDWGALVGWYLAHHHKETVLSYSALSAPHPKAFGRAARTDNAQRKKSRYMAWFQLPFLPEWYCRRNDFAGFRRLWKHADEEEVAHYLSIFRRKKSLTAALNYYRANFRDKTGLRIGKIEVPTLFIWGNRDLAIGRTAAEGNHKYMPEDYQFIEVEGGHWLIQSRYDEVKVAVVERLRKAG